MAVTHKCSYYCEPSKHVHAIETIASMAVADVKAFYSSVPYVVKVISIRAVAEIDPSLVQRVLNAVGQQEAILTANDKCYIAIVELIPEISKAIAEAQHAHS